LKIPDICINNKTVYNIYYLEKGDEMDIVNAQELEHMLNTSTKVTKEIRLLYNDKKALQVLNSFVVLAGGNIDKYLAVKLMYLFEREMLLRTGTPSLFGRLCSIPFGPIISEINDAVDSTEISALPYHDNIWQKHFLERQCLNFYQR